MTSRRRFEIDKATVVAMRDSVEQLRALPLDRTLLQLENTFAEMGDRTPAEWRRRVAMDIRTCREALRLQEELKSLGNPIRKKARDI